MLNLSPYPTIEEFLNTRGRSFAVCEKKITQGINVDIDSLCNKACVTTDLMFKSVVDSNSLYCIINSFPAYAKDGNTIFMQYCYNELAPVIENVVKTNLALDALYALRLWRLLWRIERKERLYLEKARDERKVFLDQLESCAPSEIKKSSRLLRHAKDYYLWDNLEKEKLIDAVKNNRDITKEKRVFMLEAIDQFQNNVPSSLMLRWDFPFMYGIDELDCSSLTQEMKFWAEHKDELLSGAIRFPFIPIADVACGKITKSEKISFDQGEKIKDSSGVYFEEMLFPFYKYHEKNPAFRTGEMPTKKDGSKSCTVNKIRYLAPAGERDIINYYLFEKATAFSFCIGSVDVLDKDKGLEESLRNLAQCMSFYPQLNGGAGRQQMPLCFGADQLVTKLYDLYAEYREDELFKDSAWKVQMLDFCEFFHYFTKDVRCKYRQCQDEFLLLLLSEYYGDGSEELKIFDELAGICDTLEVAILSCTPIIDPVVCREKWW